MRARQTEERHTEGRRRLQAHLDRTGMDQCDLALAIGRSNGAVSMWLSGHTLPDVESAAVLERVAGVPMRAWSQKPRRNGKAA